jgi:regulator of sigma E protease
MSVLIFFLVLFVLILVHEWGHFIAAKKTGMRVDEFGIGFPPKVFGVKKGETEYTFNLLPIGGFVRIHGENPAAPLKDEPERAFGARPYWAQAVVLVAGVTMNVIFAWVLFVMTLMIGIPASVEESKIGPDSVLYISGILPGSPLAESVKPGSSIVSLKVGDNEVSGPLTPTIFSEQVSQSAGQKSS